MPIIEREIVNEGRGPTDIVITSKRVVHRTYVKPSKVKPGDVVVTRDEQRVTVELGKGHKTTRTVEPLSEKELTDPRVRADMGLGPLEDEGDGDDAPRGRGTREQDEEEEIDEEEEEEEPEPEPSSEDEAFVGDWQAAVEMIEAAEKASDLEKLGRFREMEGRRSKPRPSVSKALEAAGV